MHVLIVLCHPEPSSFNSSLAKVSAEFFESRGDAVEISDLYKQRFDPVEKADHYSNRTNGVDFSPLAEQRNAFKTNSLSGEVESEIAKLEKADLVILQFPIWWHSVPAMLKGWMDRVFVSGGLYSSKMRYDRGYFKGRTVVCSATTGAPEVSFKPGGRGGEISQILWSTQYSLYYMGFDVLSPQVSYGVQGHGFQYTNDKEFNQQISLAISTWKSRLESIDLDTPLEYPGWDDWDDLGQLKSTD